MKFFILLLCFCSVQAPGGSSFFGSSCQYKCHCNSSCDEDGRCVNQSGQCKPGWFGLRCQYQDIAANSTIEPSDAVSLQSESCTRSSNTRFLKFTWKEHLPFTWMRITLFSKTKFKDFKILFKVGSFGNVHCFRLRLFQVGNGTFDIYCDLKLSMTQLTIEGEDVKSICSVHISGDCAQGMLTCDSKCHLPCVDQCVKDDGSCHVVCVGSSDLPPQTEVSNDSLHKCDYDDKYFFLEQEIMAKTMKFENDEEFNSFYNNETEMILETLKTESTLTPKITNTLVNYLVKAENMTSQYGFYVEDTTFKNLVKLVDKVSPSAQDSWTQEDQEETVNLNVLVSSMDRVSSSRLQSNKTKDLYLKLENIVVKIGSTNEDIRYTSENETDSSQSKGWTREFRSEIILSRKVFSHLNETVRYSILIFKNPNNEQKLDTDNTTTSDSNENPTNEIVSDIMSLSVNVPITTTLSQPVKLIFSLSKTHLELQCVFLDMSVGKDGHWSTDGCQTDVGHQNEDGRVTCTCNHLTSFAVLMSPKKLQHNKVLTGLTIAGCSISIFCLTVTIIVYFVLWRHVNSVRSVLLVNLSISMLFGYLVYLVGINRTETKLLCKVFAVVLHYFFLLVFFNFLSQSLALYTSLNNMTGKPHLRMLLTFTYVAPLVIVSVTMAVTSMDGYGATTHCWLSVDGDTLWAFLGPLIAVIFVNMLVLVLVIRVYLASHAVMCQTNVYRTVSAIRAIIVLVPLFGLTWVFGLMFNYYDHIVLQYLFVIFNTLQGFLIFLFHCVNQRQIKEAFKSFRRRQQARSLEATPKNTFTFSS
ncbi:Adhesion G protein-coupled receptor L4 [Bulinus truncatus]|nr:Adhesion G protein-coupled receptor L4 [Bulinus truncatus]